MQVVTRQLQCKLSPPFFAHTNVDTAYDAAKPLINLDNVELSRFVARLGNEFHNCWSNCTQNAQEMRAAIQQIADAVPASTVDASLVPSKALRLPDGLVASSGGRLNVTKLRFTNLKLAKGQLPMTPRGLNLRRI